MTVTPEWFANAEKAMMAADPSFIPRPGQAQMARHLFMSLIGNTHCAIDAPTGSGKSFALLVAAQNLPGRVVISTATKALQAQLRDREIPRLRDAGVLTKAAVVLDGRNNYYCRRRATHALARANPAAIPVIQELLDHDHTDGRRDSMPLAVPDWIWASVSSDADACRALECSRKTEGCYYTRARDAARTAEIVVINHHVLLADAALKRHDPVAWGKKSPEEGKKRKPGILDLYDYLIVDEAHALESAVESFGERRVSLRGMQALATRISRQPGTAAAVRKLAEAQVEVKSVLETLPHGSLLMPVAGPPFFAKAHDLAKAAADELRETHGGTLDDSVNATILADSCKSLADKLEAIDKAINTGADDFGPRAPSTDGKAVTSQLVDVSEWLSEYLWKWVPTALLSATLAVPGNREYVPRRIGLDVKGSGGVQDVPGVFDLRAQRMVYVTPRAELSNQPARVTEADVAEIRELISASGGRALVLFPALRDLQFVYDELNGSTGHRILAQGITTDGTRRKGTKDEVKASTSQLAEWFAEDTSSVLLATRTFMEGVDFPGETVSLVIIARFPNLRPDDPLTMARRLRIEATGGNPWSSYQLPAMMLIFRQAAGRAIRRIDDVGVVAVLDPRCGSKAYAMDALRSLKPSDYTNQISAVSDFLNRGDR